MNTINFKRDLRRFAERTKQNHTQVVRTVAFMLFNKIVTKTPVDTGRTRSNWDISAGSPRSGLSLDNLEPFGKVYITNNLPHVEKLEFGGYPNPPKNPTGKTIGGFSTQAPAGMVRVSIAELIAEMEVLR